MLHLSVHKRKPLVIGILLMMLCVQLFSLHAHLPDGDDHAHDHNHEHAHVHSHILGGSHDDHLNSEHDEDSAATVGTLAKQVLFLDLCFLFFLIIIPASLCDVCGRNHGQNKKRIRRLLFFQPLLRAPPVAL